MAKVAAFAHVDVSAGELEGSVAPDAWTAFADCYLDALDQIARTENTKPASQPSYSYPDSGYRRSERTRDLAEWHSLLLERLAGSEAEDRLDRLAGIQLSADPS